MGSHGYVIGAVTGASTIVHSPKGVRVSPENLCEDGPPSRACPGDVIPVDTRSRIYDRLLEGEAGSAPKVEVEIDAEAGLTLVGVAAVDWPGLATIVLSELHHLGWNLDVLEGFAVEDEGRRRGVIITGIRNDDPARAARFEADARKMADLLGRLAMGRAGTVSLLGRAAERLERFEEVRMALESLYDGRTVPEDIMGEGGELVLFISSRSDQYLMERRPDDLAWIIKTNYELVGRVRNKGGKPFFRIRNLRTEKEHLTGINIAGFEREISFQDVLTALNHAWSGASVKHQRRYSTEDGVVSIRVEMSGPTGLSATREEQQKIRSVLKQLLVSNELERLKRIHRYGGRENYARAVIPLLLRECEASSMSQAYIARVASSTFHAELKLILVSVSGNRQGHDSLVIELVKALDSREGLTVVSFKSPSRHRDRWVDIIDITVQRDAYSDLESAYSAIKEAIQSTYGDFRDFDMGMRLMDVSKVRELQEMLKEIPSTIVNDFYYRLEDFLRASASVDELAGHIRLAFDCLSELFRSDKPYLAPRSIDLGPKEKPSATLFCCCRKGKPGWFHDLLEVVKDYRVTASVIEWSESSAVLLRVKGPEGALDEDERMRALSGLSARCCGGESPGQPLPERS